MKFNNKNFMKIQEVVLKILGGDLVFRTLVPQTVKLLKESLSLTG